MSNGCTSVGKYDPATGHMSFELALDAIKRGKSVRRVSWIFEGSISHVKDAGFMFSDGKQLEFGMGAAELLAEDWIEVV